MKHWEHYKLDYDVEKLVEETDTLFPRSEYLYSDECFTKGTYFYNIDDMPQHIIDAVERSIGYKLNDYFYMWEWRESTKLFPHKDLKNHHYGQTDLVVGVCLEGTFKLNALTNRDGEIFDSIVYRPGDIIVLNNTEYFHSGELLPNTGMKRSLNCYVDMSSYYDKG